MPGPGGRELHWYREGFTETEAALMDVPTESPTRNEDSRLASSLKRRTNAKILQDALPRGRVIGHYGSARFECRQVG
jgi:hypothetical protein